MIFSPVEWHHGWNIGSVRRPGFWIRLVPSVAPGFLLRVHRAVRSAWAGKFQGEEIPKETEDWREMGPWLISSHIGQGKQGHGLAKK